MSRILSVLAAVLAAGIGWQWSGTEVPPVDPVLPVPEVPTIRPVTANAGDSARTALARPLLQPGRRPTAPSRSVAPESAPPRLTALLSGPFGRRAIVLVGGRSLTVQEGADAGGWTVLSIGSAGVSVRGRDGERLLLLSRGDTPQARVEPVPAPVAEGDEHDGGMPIQRPNSASVRQAFGSSPDRR